MVGAVRSSDMSSEHIEDHHSELDLPLRYNSGRISDHVGLHVHQLAGDRLRLGVVSADDRPLFSAGFRLAVRLLDIDIQIFVSAA